MSQTSERLRNAFRRPTSRDSACHKSYLADDSFLPRARKGNFSLQSSIKEAWSGLSRPTTPSQHQPPPFGINPSSAWSAKIGGAIATVKPERKRRTASASACAKRLSFLQCAGTSDVEEIENEDNSDDTPYLRGIQRPKTVDAPIVTTRLFDKPLPRNRRFAGLFEATQIPIFHVDTPAQSVCDDHDVDSQDQEAESLLSVPPAGSSLHPGSAYSSALPSPSPSSLAPWNEPSRTSSLLEGHCPYLSSEGSSECGHSSTPGGGSSTNTTNDQIPIRFDLNSPSVEEQVNTRVSKILAALDRSACPSDEDSNKSRESTVDEELNIACCRKKDADTCTTRDALHRLATPPPPSMTAGQFYEDRILSLNGQQESPTPIRRHESHRPHRTLDEAFTPVARKEAPAPSRTTDTPCTLRQKRERFLRSRQGSADYGKPSPCPTTPPPPPPFGFRPPSSMRMYSSPTLSGSITPSSMSRSPSSLFSSPTGTASSTCTTFTVPPPEPPKWEQELRSLHATIEHYRRTLTEQRRKTNEADKAICDLSSELDSLQERSRVKDERIRQLEAEKAGLRNEMQRWINRAVAEERISNLAVEELRAYRARDAVSASNLDSHSPATVKSKASKATFGRLMRNIGSNA